ncbi:MAG: sulfatase-like hydrolase/transferase, partial [Myxococcaceae bacterium]
DTPYYLRVFDKRGYVKQAQNQFVITNGLRTQFQFEPIFGTADRVSIRILPRYEYITAYPQGNVGWESHSEAWEQFIVNMTTHGRYTFKSAHVNYLMANLKTGLLSLAPTPSTWEEFSLEPVNNEYLKRQNTNLEFIKNGPQLQARRNPNIYLIILDTMRADFVNPITGPNLLEFKNASIHTEIGLAGATTTHPSIYTLLNSRPAYEFYALLKSGYNMGPMPLNIFKYKLGYTIKATGKRDMGCLDISPPSEYYPVSEKTYLVGREFRFGLKSHLLDDCAQTGLLGNEGFYQEGLSKLDEKIFNHLVSLSENSPRQKALFLAHLEGAHTPYQYSKEDEFVQAHFQFESEKNYASAFHKTDRLFGQFIKDLKDRDLYNESMIVVVGDHGEVLRPPPYEDGDHGAYPINKDQTRVPIYFKFPKNHHLEYSSINQVSSLADVFPTLFEYLGVLKETEQFFTGRPLSDLNTRIASVMRVNPDNEISFYVYPHKINTKYRPWAYTSSESMDQLQNISLEDFEWVSLENFEDIPTGNNIGQDTVLLNKEWFKQQ